MRRAASFRGAACFGTEGLRGIPRAGGAYHGRHGSLRASTFIDPVDCTWIVSIQENTPRGASAVSTLRERLRMTVVVVPIWKNPTTFSLKSIVAPQESASWHSQQSVDCRGAHGHDLLSHKLIEMQMPIALQGRQENRQQRPQTLSAYPIGGFPEHDQRRPRRFVIQRG